MDFIIKEGMQWPPMDYIQHKMAEHSAWYSGDAEILANFYTATAAVNFLSLPYMMQQSESFWARQITNQGEIFVHVPIAGDIAETSANFLFSEPPLIKISQAQDKKANGSYKESQEQLDKMLLGCGFNKKILEGAETAAAIGGVYIKIAWDEDVSEYPIPVIVQADKAIPEFKFGILTAVTFWKTIDADESGNRIIRLMERYEKGAIKYSLYQGTTDRLGKLVDLKSEKETEDLVDVDTYGEFLAVYIPNMLPNRLERTSSLGRSDLSGIEGLMDSLDEVFSSWIKDIALSQARILIPDSYLENSGGKQKFNVDKMLYVKLDVDPLTSPEITATQFAIRAEEFEKTSLNLMERIVTSAGYSPQSFGLNIAGRAESGTALSIRERKSFATKNKKQAYWQVALKKVVELMVLIYNEELGGTIEADSEINIAFSDSITNNITEVSNAIKMVSDAMAASVETKVRMLHPDWSEDQIQAEVDKIIEENNIGGMNEPDMGNFDMEQMDAKNKSVGEAKEKVKNEVIE